MRETLVVTVTLTADEYEEERRREKEQAERSGIGEGWTSPQHVLHGRASDEARAFFGAECGLIVDEAAVKATRFGLPPHREDGWRGEFTYRAYTTR